MKRCLKQPQEPSCLSDFRKRYPNGTWDDIKNEARTCYDEIRVIARTDQGALCAYCETALEPNDEQMAHFHPKSDTGGTRNWALGWDNLWLACKGGTQDWLSDLKRHPLPENMSCDERKGSRCLDGLILSPGQIPAFPRIFRYAQWPDRLEICPDEDACFMAGIEATRVQRTIDELNLNCPRLAEARLAHHRALENAKKRLRQSNLPVPVALQSLAARFLARDDDGHWMSFFTVTRWGLGMAAEVYLEAIRFEG